jgi:hypothetical protein
MTMEFIDKTGQPRPDQEIEEALHWVKKKIIRPDFSDPEGTIHCITIKDALEELLKVREIIRKGRNEGQ